ncbi:CHAT domain-containing protein [Dokdonia sinensis]|uniref:CHAT domain-containing protein n=1 Tax=Dokdonia sinensis TaxID=2479847 RepID=A0A3M0G6S0_9FLAO|nr:CHAT domain-containing protein [Dokdonia sinensis]RMB58022.1 CHAT domain-containing protein [Dokdonia sinensis]
MKIFRFCLVFIFFPLFLMAQSQDQISRSIDSLIFQANDFDKAINTIKINKNLHRQRFWAAKGMKAVQNNEIEKGVEFLDSVWNDRHLLQSNTTDLEFLTYATGNYYVAGSEIKGLDFSVTVAQELLQILESQNAKGTNIVSVLTDLTYLKNHFREYYKSAFYASRGIETAFKNKPIDSTTVSDLYNFLGSSYGDLGITDKALDYYKQGVSFGLNNANSDPGAMIHKLGNLVNEYIQYGDFISAKETLDILNDNKSQWLTSDNLVAGHLPDDKINARLQAVLYTLLPQLRYYAHKGDVAASKELFEEMKEIRYQMKTSDCYFLEPFYLAVLKMEMVWELEENLKHLPIYASEMNGNDCIHNYSVTKFMMGRNHFENQDYKNMALDFEDIQILGANYFQPFQARVENLKAESALITGDNKSYEEHLSKALNKLIKSEEVGKDRLTIADFNPENSVETLSVLIDLVASYKRLFEASGKDFHLNRKTDLAIITAQKFNAFYNQEIYNPKLEEISTQINQYLLEDIDNIKPKENIFSLIENNLSQHLLKTFNAKRKKNEQIGGDFAVLLDIINIKNDVLASQVKISGYATSSIRSSVDSISNIIQRETITKNPMHLDKWDISKFQEKINESEVYIRFVLGTDDAFAVAITNNQIVFKSIGSRKQLSDKISEHRNAILSRNVNADSAAKDLYHLLIEPFSNILNDKNKSRLIFITKNELTFVPFDALIDKTGAFLLEKYNTSVAFSLPLLQSQLEGNSSLERGTAIFSPEYQESFKDDQDILELKRNGLFELPFAREESLQIAEITKGDLYLADKASKQKFIENSSNYDIIHMAAHAIASDKEDNNSSILFTHDKRLNFNEIYALSIPANLVVLSACNTGIGVKKEGEDLQSLSRAFTYAGTQSTITTLWQVSDKTTKTIMSAFYKHLINGMPKAKALQQAKLDYLSSTKDSALRHPYYWAGFTLSGDARPLEVPVAWGWYLLAGVAMAILIFIIMLSQKRKKLTLTHQL